jgi:hypothetical protein
MTSTQETLGWQVRLRCGHETTVTRGSMPVKGTWISCWAIMHPEQGCQTQRQITDVTPLGQPAQGQLRFG